MILLGASDNCISRFRLDRALRAGPDTLAVGWATRPDQGAHLVIRDPMHFRDAVELALSLPRVRDTGGDPEGWAVYPPEGAEPVVRLRQGAHSLFTGRTIRGQGHGVVGMLWHGVSDEHAAIRVWTTLHDQVTDHNGFTSMSHPWDCYDGAIESIEALYNLSTGERIPIPPKLMGWEVGPTKLPIE